MSSATLTAAPEFSLPSVAGGSIGLSELHADGPALLLFVSEECPTCVLTLRRLAPVVSELDAAGGRVAALVEDPPRGGASQARLRGQEHLRRRVVARARPRRGIRRAQGHVRARLDRRPAGDPANARTR